MKSSDKKNSQLDFELVFEEITNLNNMHLKNNSNKNNNNNNNIKKKSSNVLISNKVKGAKNENKMSTLAACSSKSVVDSTSTSSSTSTTTTTTKASSAISKAQSSKKFFGLSIRGGPCTITTTFTTKTPTTATTTISTPTNVGCGGGIDCAAAAAQPIINRGKKRSRTSDTLLATATAILRVLGVNPKSGRGSKRKGSRSNNKISGQQQVISTMPAMPKEKSSPVPLTDSNFTEIKMKEQLVSTSQYIGCVGGCFTNSDILTGTTVIAATTTTTTPPQSNTDIITIATSANLINNCCRIDNKMQNNHNHNNLINKQQQQQQQQQTAAANNKLNNSEQVTRMTMIGATTTTTPNGIITSSANDINATTPATTTASTTATTSSASLTLTSSSTTTGTVSSSTPLSPSQSATTPRTTTHSLRQRMPMKKSANDYVFGKYIGEGSFSTVYLARDIHTNKEYAIKVCEKQHILREKKQDYIKREREVMHQLSNVPGFVNLSCTFQDPRSLYFVMTLAKNGDLLPYINKVGSFDLDCTRHYVAELVLAVENMHKRGIIHRDLKPENILLDENMHTLIADFGSAKICANPDNPDSNHYDTTESESESEDELDLSDITKVRRKGSFVGTAQYVSPEVLQGQKVTKAADLWALGCITYQMISGLPPFRGGSDYLIFREIMSVNLVFPEGFDKDAEDLVRSLLKLNPLERIGAQDKCCGHYESIRTHPFFEGINFDTVRYQIPPQIYPYLPGASREEELRSQYRVPDHLEPGLDDRQLTRLLGLELGTVSGIEIEKKTEPKNIFNISEAEKQRRLEVQKMDKWHQFSDGEVILKKGFVNKRKGLFARKRMLLLTTGPRLIYIDPVQMVKKGEIPWSPELRVEPKNFKIFFVHTKSPKHKLIKSTKKILDTSFPNRRCILSHADEETNQFYYLFQPNRTYYLEDPEGYALEWVAAIEDVRQKSYGEKS